MAGRTDVPNALRRGRHDRWVLRLLEYLVVGTVIAVLAGVFLTKVRHLQVEAERMAMLGVVKTLEGAVVLSGTLQQLGLQGDYGTVESGCNPMTLLEKRPAGYIGERDHPAVSEIPDGAWYFDVSEKALIYRVKAADHFVSTFGPPAQARFRVQRKTAGPHRLTSEAWALVSLGDYKWVRRGRMQED